MTPHRGTASASYRCSTMILHFLSNSSSWIGDFGPRIAAPAEHPFENAPGGNTVLESAYSER